MQNIPTKIAGRPTIGVSRCLLGERVRYDSASKTCLAVVETLAELFELIPICPEVEAGLGIPRPPVQLSGNIMQPRMTGRDDPDLDVTELVTEFTQQCVPQLNDIDGFVFKSRSPSCGLNSTPVYIDGVCVTESSRGIFARGVCQQYPDLPMIEDSELDSDDRLQEFISAVMARAQTKK